MTTDKNISFKMTDLYSSPQINAGIYYSLHHRKDVKHEKNRDMNEVAVEDLVWERLALIPDPEIPVVSITELGIVREVRYEGNRLRIVITPTYTGCPAMQLFVAEIRAAMHDMGIDEVAVDTVYSPAWTTDWISPAALERLRQYGIAPPVKPAPGDDPLAEPKVVPCPHCGSEETTLRSQFGATACKALYVCNSCKEPFEYFKHF